MRIQTKNRLILEPVSPANVGLWNWLKAHLEIEGSNVFNEIVRLYETAEYNYQRKLEDYNHAKGMEQSL